MKCYMAGIPRANYMPYPFQIVQTPQSILMAYEYASANRVINMEKKPVEASVDTWMGTANGHWEGDTLVVDNTGFNDQSWFDRAGDFHSDQLHVVERFTLIDADHMNYEATIEDPQVFTRPWKISLPLVPAHREERAVDRIQMRGVRRRAAVRRRSQENEIGDSTMKAQSCCWHQASPLACWLLARPLHRHAPQNPLGRSRFTGRLYHRRSERGPDGAAAKYGTRRFLTEQELAERAKEVNSGEKHHRYRCTAHHWILGSG